MRLHCSSSALLSEYNRLKGLQTNGHTNGDRAIYNGNSDADLLAEARVLRQHKGRLESRMQTLEDHNRQLEAQLQRLRQLLEQVKILLFLILNWIEYGNNILMDIWRGLDIYKVIIGM